MALCCPVMSSASVIMNPTWGFSSTGYRINTPAKKIGMYNTLNYDKIRKIVSTPLGQIEPEDITYNTLQAITSSIRTLNWPGTQKIKNRTFKDPSTGIVYYEPLLLYFSLSINPEPWAIGSQRNPECEECSGGGNDRDFFGGGSPPLPRRKKECDCMNCGCSCNDIATMLARQLAESNRQIESLKDFVLKTATEQVEINQKQLQAISIDLDLQPVVNRLNEVESNLWNGIKRE